MIARRAARLMLYAGIVGVVLALSKMHAAYIADPPYSFTGSSRFAWAVTYMLILGVTAYGLGLPELTSRGRSRIGISIAATALAAVGISALQLVVGDALLPRFVVFGTAIALVPWYLVCIAVSSGGRSQAEERDRVVVVAPLNDATTLESDLSFEPERPAQIVASLTVEGAHDGDSLHPRALLRTFRSHRATVLVLSREAQVDSRVVGQAAFLHESGSRVRTMSQFYEQWLGKLPLYEMERVSLLFDISEIHRARYVRLKRLSDLVLGGIASVVFLLALPFVLIGNLIANRGPLFYTQPRVGKNGSIFEIVKFRTMKPNAEGSLVPEWTSDDDPRITSFGRILRRTHVDELPQAVNILRGDLSVVGPRPEQPHYVAELSEKLPFYDLRHLVRPGLTGWAQVKYGYAGDERDALEKLQYEFYYLRHQGLGLDARIIGRTLRTVLGREGR